MSYPGRAAQVSAASLLVLVGAASCNLVTGVSGLVVVDTGGASAGGSPATGGQASTTGGGAGGAGGAPHPTSSSSTTSSSTTTAASSASSTTSTTSSGSSTDPAQLCVDTINKLRATRGLPPYARWTAEETCVSQEATGDGMMMSAHYTFIHTHPCNSSAENECPNWAKNPLDPNLGIVACLNQMWAEKNQPGCAGCDTCDFPYQNCTNCTAEGATVCGHYLDMKSSVLSKVACGFWSGGWYTQDFQ